LEQRQRRNVASRGMPSSECSAGLRRVLLMLQHLDHSRNRPTATDEKKKNLLCFCCDFSGWFNFRRKSLKLLPPDVVILKLQCTKFDFGLVGLRPDPAGGAYSAVQTVFTAVFKRA